MSKTTRPRGFTPWNPNKSSQILLDQVNDVLTEYAEYIPLTIRQVFYRLVAKHDYGKTEKCYIALQELLVRARRSGRVSMSSIRDDGFYQTAIFTVKDADDAMMTYRSLARQATIDRQEGQDRRITVWCEARGMANMLETVCLEYGVQVVTSGGFDSVTAKHGMGARLARHSGMVLHLGDHDPSGCAMFDALEEDILAFADYYGGVPSLERIAVLPKHIDQYSLPTAPPKENDKRGVFTDTRTVQLEALPPDVLLSILRTEIEHRLDMDVFHGALEREAGVRQELKTILSAGGANENSP